MRKMVALLVLAMVPFFVNAQDAPQTINLSFYGESAYDCATALADDLGAELVLHGLKAEELDMACWLVREDATLAQAIALFSAASGYQVEYDAAGKVLHLLEPGPRSRSARVKGYDVSVLSGRFVEYVNTYGAARTEQPKGEPAEPELTGAQHLASVLEEILYEPRGADSEPSVVGDRLLFTLSESDHARVREVLDLLVAESGGESSALAAERAEIAKLAGAKFKPDMEATPIASVLTAICKSAGLGIAIGPDFAEIAVSEHIDFVNDQEITALDALNQILARLEPDGLQLNFFSRDGAVIIESADMARAPGYCVYDVADLMKKLEAAYQRQRTAPGKDEGFNGDLRHAGGNRVVLDALEDLLFELNEGENATCIGYGTRVIVRGGVSAVDSATAILKEMGWEPPKK